MQIVHARWAVAAALLSAGASAQAPGAPGTPVADAIPEAIASDFSGRSGYQLVWSDEFSSDGLPDPARWRYDTHRNREGWYNAEAQYYASARYENSRVENGQLIIEARAERLNRRQFPDWGGQRYTSARLYTRGVQAWRYGFFEIRAKLPCGIGTWPAIWMLPEDGSSGWPRGGEIDIMEHVGHVPGEIHQTIHTEAYNHIRNTHRTARFRLEDACTQMHRYQLLWTPEYLVAGVDDQPRFLFRNEGGDMARWPFDRPMNLLLNIAVGGSWGGQQGIRPDAFPARFEIDYVRVYQRPPTRVGSAMHQHSERR
ncbi:MAG: glycoside hydrolase family 16 protein [Sphingopyxis sp.]|nr:glycoside hydrolase family 16 protein [Sphingopyxis sp.]